VDAKRAADAAATAQIAGVTRVERARIRSESRVDAWIRKKRRSRRRQQIADIKAAQRAEMRAAAAASRARRRFAKETIGGAGRRVTGAVGTMGRVTGGLLALGGGFAAAGAIGHRIRAERASAELANQAFMQGGAPGRTRGAIHRSVMQQTQQEGIRTGLGQERMIDALRRVIQLAGGQNLEIAQKLLPVLGEFALASGADVADVGQTAGQVMLALGPRGVTGQQALEDTEEILASMAGQAKVGAIEFRDLASEMGKVMSATAGFKGNIKENVKTLGAFAQLSLAGGATESREAMTAINRFRDDITSLSARFEKAGVNVFGEVTRDPKTGEVVRSKLRDPIAIVADVLEKTGGDLPTMAKLFGVRGRRVITGFQESFVSAGAGKEGQKAWLEVLNTVRKAKMETKERKESFAFMTGTTGVKLAQQMERLNIAMGDKLMPTVIRLVPRISDLIEPMTRAAEVVAGFVEFLLDNPYRGIGTIIAAKVALDIAGAGIGAGAQRAITALINAYRPPVPGGGVPGGGVVPIPGGGGAAGQPRGRMARAGQKAVRSVGGAAAAGAGLGIASLGYGLVETALKEAGATKGSLNPLATREGDITLGSAAKGMFVTANPFVSPLVAGYQGATGNIEENRTWQLLQAYGEAAEIAGKKLLDFASGTDEATLKLKMIEIPKIPAPNRGAGATPPKVDKVGIGG
jgi:hypothetical protein